MSCTNFAAGWGSSLAQRSDIHVALFGDPGTGKTVMSNYALSLSLLQGTFQESEPLSQV